MADYTKYLRLIKPAGNEYYNIENFNHNAELIDKETEDLSNKVAEIQQGATREKTGIVQFGTEEGKALEGMMLARLAGCVGYGGDIQEPGVKDINYIYYDRNTRKMYKCLNQNSDVSANVANFIPLDNNSLLDRLENLTRKTILLFYNGGSLVPNGTTSIPINEDWYFFGIGVGTAVQSGKERMCFLFRNIFQSSNDILRFNGIEIRYNATNKTLTVSNNGGNLYFLEQYSSLT
ncbi:hypothetical protein [Fusobacterium animalis]|uniref:hypothetical protein n=1 Tax=Fusobacterium animalis TaxID=76859 RepID=UPI0030D07C10